MALILKDRVRESSTSSGTGSITLAGAFSGYQTFNSAVASGSTVYYTIHNTTVPNDGEWEVGVGTFTSPSTLSRDTVFSSSAGGTTKVSFSGSSTLEVFITQPAEQAVYINDATGKVEVFGNGTNTVTFTNATADLFTGNGSAISAINASNISSGTIDNARTTASDANGASTIVARDANGSFTANAGTFTSISGNGVALTAINASNISTGTIANARTTASDANGASTIVSRSAAGSFAGNVITATTFSGSGASLTNIPNSATTANSANGASTIVARDANGSFAGNVITGTTGTFTSVSGNGVALTAINASNISSGTIANARTTAASANGASTIVARGTSGEFSAGAITSTSISGNGVALTAINASNISSGTIANARTTASDANGASTIVARDANGSFTANIITANGSAISAINASNVSAGTLADARLSSNIVTLTATQTLTNKFVTPRVSSAASITSPLAWNSDNFDQYAATAQAGALTINADAGTPVDGEKMIFRFEDNGTARALTWTTGVSKGFREVGVLLPTTTVINKTVYVGCIYNAADDRWDAVAVAQEA